MLSFFSLLFLNNGNSFLTKYKKYISLQGSLDILTFRAFAFQQLILSLKGENKIIPYLNDQWKGISMAKQTTLTALSLRTCRIFNTALQKIEMCSYFTNKFSASPRFLASMFLLWVLTACWVLCRPFTILVVHSHYNSCICQLSRLSIWGKDQARTKSRKGRGPTGKLS